MIYKILADIVVAIHFLWIVFLILGGLLGMRHRVFRIFHISGLVFAFVIQATGWYCPLTDLEVWLRSHQAHGLAYRGSFIIHYMEELVYIDLSHRTIVALTVLLCAFNGWLYLRKR